MPESFFSYNVTRKYPYRWFTWVVVLGGIAAATILSVINLAANGYELSVMISTNPNETESPKNPRWFQKRPWSLASKVSPKCQDQTLLVGSQLYSSNFGLPYRIASIYKNGTQPMASCAYHNDFLHECSVAQISFYRVNDTVWPEPWVDASATINCTIYDGSALVTIVLDLSVQIMPGMGIGSIPGSDPPNMPAFLNMDNTTHASLDWGRTMIFLNIELLSRFQVYAGWQSYLFRPALNSHTSVAVEVVFEASDEFAVVVLGTHLNGGQIDESPLSNKIWTSKFGMDLLSLNWEEAGYYDGFMAKESDGRTISVLILDDLAKTLYSSILSDLGQATDTNVFASPQKTMDLFNKTDHLIGKLPDQHQFRSDSFPPFISRDPPTDIDEFYRWSGIAPPFVTPATISTQYICQVPKLKSTGSLIISVIVADFVLLQVLWTILNWITTFIVERRNPQAHHCSGCVGAIVCKDHDEGIRQPYEPLPRISRTSTLINPSIRSFMLPEQNRIRDEEGVTDELVAYRDRRASEAEREVYLSPNRVQYYSR